jgi:TPR repeat protein
MKQLTHIGFFVFLLVASLFLYRRYSTKDDAALTLPPITKTEVSSTSNLVYEVTDKQDSTKELDPAQEAARAKVRLVKAYEDVIPWLKKCAEKNDRDAQFVLAKMYEDGQVFQQDLIEAYKWFSLSATLGGKDAAEERKVLQSKLTQDQISEGEKRISLFATSLKTTKDS